jgi:lysophospholipase L1-like esterase
VSHRPASAGPDRPDREWTPRPATTVSIYGMGQIGVHVSRPLALAMAPVLVAQGAWVRRRTPLLPEADGERHGVEGIWRDDALAVLLLGDSTAAGVGVRTQAEGLAPTIAAVLARHSGRPASWRIAGRTGSTAQRALTHLVPQLLDESFDIVVVVLGFNDVLRTRRARAFQDDVAALVTGLLRHLRPGGGIVLGGIPDLAIFPSLPQPMRTLLALHARHLNRCLIRAAANAQSTVYASAPPIESRTFFAEDGLHPNAEAYRLWATHLADVATAILESRR